MRRGDAGMRSFIRDGGIGPLPLGLANIAMSGLDHCESLDGVLYGRIVGHDVFELLVDIDVTG